MMCILSIVAVLGVIGGQVAPLGEVLAKGRAYVAEFEQRFSLLVAEEHYTQEVREQVASGGGNLSRANPGGGFSAPSKRGQRRVLRSDYLLVRLPDGGGWMPFRDVFEVDGRKVRDREERLASLFLKPSDSSLSQAIRIMQDSTRHNLGDVVRTINIPTLALMLLHQSVTNRFEFVATGTEAVAGRPAVIVQYREVQRPALIRTGPDRELPLRGQLWIDPASGVVLRTSLTTSDPSIRAEIDVTFREDQALGLWVPAEMTELYVETADEREIVGKARYSNHRRFTVSTDEVLKKPQ